MNLNLFFFVLIVFSFNSLNAQFKDESTIAISMKPDTSKKTILNTRSIFSNLKDSLHFDGLPEKLLDYRLKYFSFNPAQHHFDRYRKGLIPKGELERWFKQLAFDSSDVINKYFKHTTYALTGLNSDGKKIVIIDLNQNLNFSDDQIMQFDTIFFSLTTEQRKLKLGQLPKLKLQYEYIDPLGNSNIRYTWFSIDPYSDFLAKYPSEIDRRLELSYVYSQWEKGEIQDNGKVYSLFVKNTISHPAPYKGKLIQLYLQKNTSKIDSKDFYDLEDTLLIGDYNYVFKKLSIFGDTLFLKKTGLNMRPIGYRQGFYAQDTQIKLLNGDSLQLYSMLNKGQYVILDFWGTWCKPCIAKLPEVKKLYEKITLMNDIKMISIAYEDNLEKVKDFIASEQISWSNGFELISDRSLETHSPITTLKVTSFPSFFLIQPNGKIIATDFDEISKWVDTKLVQK